MSSKRIYNFEKLLIKFLFTAEIVEYLTLQMNYSCSCMPFSFSPGAVIMTSHSGLVALIIRNSHSENDLYVINT